MKARRSTATTPTTLDARLRPVLVLLLSLLPMASCVQVEPRPDFDKARHLVGESTGRSEVFDPYAPALSDEELEAIFADGLSLDEALRLALVNNRDLQAEFQEIGIAHADWVQSQLLSNPSFSALLRFPTGGGRSWLEATVGMQLLELWRIPARKEAAGRNLQATVLRIARRAGVCLAEAREAYYGAVAAEELRLVAEENVKLARLSFDAVKGLHDAGAADAFDESMARGPLLAAQLMLQTARIEASSSRRDLAKRLSVRRLVGQLQLTDSLPQRGSPSYDSEALVQQALTSRLDLQALAAGIQGLDARVRFEQRQAWGDLAAGVAAERPAGNGDWLVGPSLLLTPPIFDQNQAQIARAEFQREQLIKLYESAQVAVVQDVRSGLDRVTAAWDSLAFYEDEFLPRAEQSLGLARESYSAGRSNVLALVEAQRQLLEARRVHVTLRLEAAVSSSDLERVVGTPVQGHTP